MGIAYSCLLIPPMCLVRALLYDSWGSECENYSSETQSELQVKGLLKKSAMSYPDLGSVIYNEELGAGKSRKLSLSVSEMSTSSMLFS